MLTTSYRFVRDAGLESRYRQLVSPEFAGELPASVTLEWFPFGVGLEHYRIMDALFPDPVQQLAFGRQASEMTQNTHLRTLARGLAAVGPVTPCTLLKRAPRIFSRLLRGGAVGAWHTGPKDARLELHGYPIVTYSYVRTGWQGMLEGSLGLFSRRCFLREDLRFRTDERVAWTISWV